MKVLFVTNLYPTYKNPDFGVFTKEQIDAVFGKGVTGDVIFINAKEHGIIEYWKSFKKIRKVYRNYSFIHCFHGLALICAFFATRKIPILISFLNEIKYESYKKNKFVNRIISTIYYFIVSSKRVYKIFKDKIPTKNRISKKSFYLPNGVDLTKFYPLSKEIACSNLELDITKNYVLFVSSKDINRSQKRFDIFTQTLAILKSQQSELNFEELILSNVPRELCIYYYNAASIHLLTSDFEGSPNSVKESMSCNIPVVSTDVGNVKLMFKGASNCFIAEQNPKVLASYVLRALASPPCDLRDVLIKNKLTTQEKTIELINIYKFILNEKGDFKI